MRRGELIFCALEQKLTHPHLVCRRFEPAERPHPEAVRQAERQREVRQALHRIETAMVAHSTAAEGRHRELLSVLQDIRGRLP
jgi:hypothetical protein